MSDTDLDEKGLPPVMVSMGGFPYNGEHIEHWRERALKAEASINALSQAPAPEGWRDISTAPKDGTRITTCGGGLVGTSRWAEKFYDDYSGNGAGWYSEQLVRRHEPTLWQPLPTPPKEG